MYDIILLAVDGSPGSERAQEFAFELAEQYDAQIHLIYVVDTRRFSEPALSSLELATDELEDWAHDLLDDLQATGQDRDIEITRHCCHGIPHEEIVEYADSIDADVTVMGFQGTSHEQKMGSVDERVLRDSERPVLAV